MCTNRPSIIGLTLLMIAGCHRAPPVTIPEQPAGSPADLVEVAFYLPGMNRELKIL